MNGRLFLHVGLPKTASTFLQWNVFPMIPNVTFLDKGRSIDFSALYRSDDRKILISHEHLLANPFTSHPEGWLAEFRENLDRLASWCPEAKILLSLRAHEDLLTSYYKEYISKPGRTYLARERFFDVHEDGGLIRHEDLEFTTIIKEVDRRFDDPFIFLFEDVIENIDVFLQDLGAFLGEPSPAASELPNDRVNPGVRHYQAKLLVRLNRLDEWLSRIPFAPSLYNPLFRRLSIQPDRLCRKHLRCLADRPLRLTEEQRVFVRERYSEDWRRVQARVEADRKRRRDRHRARSANIGTAALEGK